MEKSYSCKSIHLKNIIVFLPCMMSVDCSRCRLCIRAWKAVSTHRQGGTECGGEGRTMPQASNSPKSVASTSYKQHICTQGAPNLFLAPGDVWPRHAPVTPPSNPTEQGAYSCKHTKLYQFWPPWRLGLKFGMEPLTFSAAVVSAFSRTF